MQDAHIKAAVHEVDLSALGTCLSHELECTYVS